MDSKPNFEDEADSLVEEDVDTLDESLILFRLSGPNEELSRDVQSFDMHASDEDSTVQSPYTKPKR